MKINRDNILQIARCDNGYLLLTEEWSSNDDDGNNEYTQNTEVVEEGGTDKETITKLLEKVSEWTGESYDKFGKENLRISWDKKGHKVG